jgi:hypothetical protein
MLGIFAVAFGAMTVSPGARADALSGTVPSINRGRLISLPHHP